MNKVVQFMEDRIMPPLFKMASNKYLLAIRDAFTSTLAIVLIGSMFLLICYFPNDTWAEIVAPYVSILNVPNVLTLGMIALYMSFAIGYSLANTVKLQPLVNGVATVAIFLIMVNPLTEEGTLSLAYMGSQGIFCAILAGVITVTLNYQFTKRGILIKMPDSVPPVISAAFEMLISLSVIVVIVWGIRLVLGVNIPELISLIISPLAVAADSPLAVLSESLVSRSLWFAGIHGGSIIAFNGGALYPFALANIEANAAAVAAGQAMPYIITPSFESFFQDSSVSAFAICIMMAVKCRSSHLKEIGKLAMVPAVFGVTEPLWFGMPIVLNPIMLIPFLFTNTFNLLMTWLLSYLNVIGRTYITLHWALPGFLGSYLSSGGNVANLIWWLILMVLNCFIYYPFIKMYDRQKVDEETAVTV
ncbi:PTS sugar transporter subunit IIC [Breznakia pachnodae]|uniref:Permease IIC component n=1 Tax=Breznakia pachnodae TaxID=265178 RepID=A0ABU0E4K6_9FIRM|nr:PTS transporter subunit EIIC [Breznakia pachnodae]MDQ0361807.1 PTS system cellobiose-specific IIC component [Breznakia pachnodae]